MNTLLQGFLQFRAWLPEALIELVEPSGTADPRHVRTLVALAITAFLWSFVARTLWGVGMFLGDRAAGRRLVVQVATPLSWLAWLIGAGAACLPWLALWLTGRDGHVPWGLVTGAATLALLWAALRVAERDRVFLLPAADCLVITRALPGTRMAEHRIALELLLQPGDTPAQRDSTAFLRQQLGSDRALTRYLQAVRRRRAARSRVSG